MLNANLRASSAYNIFEREGPHVSDHRVSFVLIPASETGQVGVRLSKLGRSFWGTMHADGRVTIEDGSGEIELENVGGAIDIEDGSGEIEIRGARSGVRISDASGSIDVSDVAGDFVVTNDGSGSIDYDNVRGRVDIPRRKR